MLAIEIFVLGPVETNAYLVADSVSGEAVVIDPAWDGDVIVAAAQKQQWHINQIWLTHAHFDHIAGAAEIVKRITPAPSIALHTDDLGLYRMQGGASFFGIRIDPAPLPNVTLSHGQALKLGSWIFEVRHAPGHTPGHVVFYQADERVVFCGDVIFQGSVGRTDLPGGSYRTLMNSIKEQILSLPDETRLLSGHGPETTVGQERKWNPFLS
jgi:glyoxylase-like metal-dependent hydrolase (beta-lactamase superfamily II)